MYSQNHTVYYKCDQLAKNGVIIISPVLIIIKTIVMITIIIIER